jgi:hypothetical protein
MAIDSARRVAENETRFRNANEGIEARATELGYHVREELVPFLCECGDERCTEVIRVTLVEYETVRSNPLHFLCRRGHERVAETTGAGHLVRREDRFVVVEKEGDAAAVAEERDPRGEGARG